MKSLMKQVGAAAAALALVAALAGTASAVTIWATPDDWYSSADDAQGENSNDPAFWEDRFELDEGECVKIEGAALDAVMNEDGSASLGVAYEFVIVKQANPNAKDVTYDNTIFEDVAADETVFADTNGDGVYTDADSNGISHIIVCDPADTTTTTDATTTTTTTDEFTTTEGGITTTTTTDEFSTTEAGLTTTITQEDTDTLGGNASGQQAPGPWLLLAALGVLLGSLIVVAPSRAKTRQ